jgi:hypothetical protein
MPEDITFSEIQQKRKELASSIVALFFYAPTARGYHVPICQRASERAKEKENARVGIHATAQRLCITPQNCNILRWKKHREASASLRS